MQQLHSPWRSKYIETFSKPGQNPGGCVLCRAYKEERDDEMLIVLRGKFSYVVMNRYPYNSGHVMVVPYRHLASVLDLIDDESLEIMQLIQRMVRALKQVSHPDGFNVGANFGRVAGAGIDEHIHFHIVPRWNGDSNFMPVLSDTKIISEDIVATLGKIRQALQMEGKKGKRGQNRLNY